jgi:hypothetical protein
MQFEQMTRQAGTAALEAGQSLSQNENLSLRRIRRLFAWSVREMRIADSKLDIFDRTSNPCDLSDKYFSLARQPIAQLLCS